MEDWCDLMLLVGSTFHLPPFVSWWRYVKSSSVFTIYIETDVHTCKKSCMVSQIVQKVLIWKEHIQNKIKTTGDFKHLIEYDTF